MSIPHLPDELLHAIFTHSSVRDAARLAQVGPFAVLALTPTDMPPVRRRV